MTLITQKDTLKEEILNNFQRDKIDARVIAFLETILESIEYTNNISYKKTALLLLVTQLILYFKASDELLVSGVVRDNKAKLPVINILQVANDKIIRLLDTIGITPLADAKISKLKEKQNTRQDGSELLAVLTE